ncbi:hypothetical protein TELCIR_01302 [Teladorsagia circumcincta]|uniref:Endonuclease/exonuclease/phosphatase domain-containing protein n=1 Tax=Teladorsagia circumcincta TaxID=45464 RepID=A0A2G9V2K7_TELCI|nr:hypothetical protein TELCIR_01302 [Teladorsagia circumcincta]
MRRTRVSQLIACTYNCRSVSSAAQLPALIDEAKRIRYHVIGLSETKRKEPLSCTWTDGTSVFLGARKMIQHQEVLAYAPTADSDEEQHDIIYEQLEKLVSSRHGYVLVMGDFYARIGSRKAGEVFIGPHSAEERYEPGERLASFCESHHLYLYRRQQSILQGAGEKVDSYLSERTALPRN